MASKEKLSPEEIQEIRRVARERQRREKAAHAVYAELPEAEKRAVDSWAHETAKAAVLASGVAVDGPRFGPPHGAFWGLVAEKRDVLWLERLWNGHGRAIRAKLDEPATTHDWLNSDKIPVRTGAVDVRAVLGSVGAMPSGLESRPRSNWRGE